jgi:hypothetical protein
MASSPIRRHAGKVLRTDLRFPLFIDLKRQLNEKKSLRIIFRSATDVSEWEDTAIVFLFNASMGRVENKKILRIGPEELIESQGIIEYLSLCLRYSMEEEGLTSISPSLNILFRLDGTPLINLYSEQLHSFCR